MPVCDLWTWYCTDPVTLTPPTPGRGRSWGDFIWEEIMADSTALLAFENVLFKSLHLRCEGFGKHLFSRWRIIFCSSPFHCHSRQGPTFWTMKLAVPTFWNLNQNVVGANSWNRFSIRHRHYFSGKGYIESPSRWNAIQEVQVWESKGSSSYHVLGQSWGTQ